MQIQIPFLAIEGDSSQPPAETTAGTGTATGTGTGPQQKPGSQFSSLIMMVGIFLVIIYLFMWRPQKKQKEERKQLMSNLKKNDKIVTIGGIHGTVQQVKAEEQKVVIRVDDKTNMTFSLSAVQTINPKKADEQKP